LRKFKLNSAAEVSPSQFENDVDEQFMQDVGSIITLEDGSSLDLRKAVLLYNPKTKKVQISDSESYPEDFIQLASLNITPQKPEVSEDESFEESTEEGAEEGAEEIPEIPDESDESAGGEPDSESGDNRMGETTGSEDSGDFFQ
jgi:hypothetical protein